MNRKRFVVACFLLGALPCPAGVYAAGASPADVTVPLRDLGIGKLAEWGFVDVTAVPFFADPTGRQDSTAALQEAVNFARDHQMVCFFPPGEYRVSDTLRCEQYRPMRSAGRRKGTRDYPCVLVGSRRSKRRPRIVLTPHSSGFGNPDRPRYVVHFLAMGTGTETPIDQLRAETVLAFLGIRTLQNSSAAYCLHWQSGRRSIFRDTNIVFSFRAPPQGPARALDASEAEALYNRPVVQIDGHGGGLWYNFHQENSRGHGRDYRHLLIDGTTEPLHMYQCNPEHARSDANLEMRGASHVSLYGVKGEYNQPIIWVRDCDRVRVFGYGGNAAAHAGQALFVIERTPNFLLANLVDSPRMPQGIPDTYFAGDGVDPRSWHMVLERTTAGGSILSPPLDRPVLYKRGDTVADGGREK